MEKGPYAKFSQAKVAVAKYASEHGVAAALHHYIKKLLELKESTVRTWQNGYIAELQRKQKIQDDMCIKELPEKKRERPLLLGDELDKQIKSYIGYSGVARPSLMVGHIFLSMISYWHAGSYVHLLKIVVCMKNALATNSSKTNVKA